MPAKTERTVVRTYVPAYQKEEWAAAADELDMSQSEFVRTMVQAGRREFEIPARSDGTDESEDTDRQEATPGVEPLETRLLEALERGPLSWEDIVAGITGDIEERADACLQELQKAGRVRYSGRDGGYVLTDE
jgi:hypothetical protein